MIDRLPAFHRPGRLNAIIETPRGSRNKYSYLEETGGFRLGKELPAGAVFPFDFGFVPSTLASDGDPLDVLVLLDGPTFPGCLVRSRLLGVIEARQTGRSGRSVRNPRLIAAARKSSQFRQARSLEDLPESLVDDVVHFFESYNAATGKRFAVTGRRGVDRARELIAQAERRRTRADRRAERPGSKPGSGRRR
ncbi:MAG: inorganic diphosphatase [Chloroflexota bacterium]